MAEFDTLYALAEIAVAMAGFSAIVVLFKRDTSGRWLAAHADRFNGMLLHAMASAFFCILPPLVAVFVDDAATVWAVASSALGLQLLVHAAILFWLPSTGLVPRLLLVLAVGAIVLQALNVLGIHFEREFGPCLAGVLWHLFQAGTLFVGLVWVPVSETQGG